jgi:hypothetical protein
MKAKTASTDYQNGQSFVLKILKKHISWKNLRKKSLLVTLFQGTEVVELSTLQTLALT